MFTEFERTKTKLCALKHRSISARSRCSPVHGLPGLCKTSTDIEREMKKNKRQRSIIIIKSRLVWLLSGIIDLLHKILEILNHERWASAGDFQRDFVKGAVFNTHYLQIRTKSQFQWQIIQI